MFHLSENPKQSVALSGQFVPLDWCSQTRCLEKWVHLIKSFRHSLFMVGEDFGLGMFSQTGWSIHSFRVFLFIIQLVFGFLNERKWRTALFVNIWINVFLRACETIFPFIVMCANFYGYVSVPFLFLSSNVDERVMKTICYFFVAFISLALLQLSCYNRYAFSDSFSRTILAQML